MLSKATLAVTLSQLAPFQNPKQHLEQYPTDGETAASLLHTAALHGDIAGKHVLDAGCGTGVLGIGCLLLGARHVTFIDSDEDALGVLRENLRAQKIAADTYTVIHAPLTPLTADTVVMNPPFGVQRTHADRSFLEAAFRSAPVIYSIHLAGSEAFLEALAARHAYRCTHRWEHQLPLRPSMPGHRKRLARVPVVAVRLAQGERKEEAL